MVADREVILEGETYKPRHCIQEDVEFRMASFVAKHLAADRFKRRMHSWSQRLARQWDRGLACEGKG